MSTRFGAASTPTAAAYVMADPHRPLGAVTIDDAVSRYGINRSRIYELVGRKVLDARKAGRRTIITVASLEAYLASLPPAVIRAPRKPGDATQQPAI